MHLNICCVLLISFLWINSVTSQEYSGCDHYKNVEPNKEYVFASPRYPQSVRSKNCRWFYEAPFGYRLSILCQVDVSWVSVLDKAIRKNMFKILYAEPQLPTGSCSHITNR